MKNKLDLEKMTKEELIKEVLRLSEANTKYFENWEKEKKGNAKLYKEMCLLKSKYFGMEYSKIHYEESFMEELYHRTKIEYLLNKMGLIYDLEKKQIFKMPNEDIKKFL